MNNREVFGVLIMKMKMFIKKSIVIVCFVVLLSFVSIGTSFAETFPYDDSTAPTYSSQVTDTEESTSVPSGSAYSDQQQTLPDVTPKDIVVPKPFGLTDLKDEPKLFWGFAMWLFCGVMLAVILAVILTAKTKAYRGGGKKRYSTGNKMGGSKHLLNEKYYQTRKRK